MEDPVPPVVVAEEELKLEEQQELATQTPTTITQEASSSPKTTQPSKPTGSPNPHSKPCTLCFTPRDVLIRCQIDSTKTWHLICTGKCWRSVSGGQVGGDTAHPDYRYGGMWRNKYEVASAKIKGKAKEVNEEGPFFKSMYHRRWGRSTKGKNRKERVEIFNEDGEGEGSEDEEDMDHVRDVDVRE